MTIEDICELADKTYAEGVVSPKTGSYYSVDENQNECACLLGAAALALHPMMSKWEKGNLNLNVVMKIFGISYDIACGLQQGFDGYVATNPNYLEFDNEPDSKSYIKANRVGLKYNRKYIPKESDNE